MSHNDSDLPVRLTLTPCIASDHSPGIESVKERTARELRTASQFQFRKHFIRHRRISDVGLADSPVTIFRPDFIDHLGDVVGNDCTEITGVNPIPPRAQSVTHSLIYLVNSCNNRSYETSASHNNVDTFNRNPF